MKSSSKSVSFFYGTITGRFILKTVMKLHLDRIAVSFLRSPFSKVINKWFAERNNIDIKDEEFKYFHSFRDLFARTKSGTIIDMDPSHLISPCDGWLSVFPIDKHSCFSIKSSYYRIEDFLQDKNLAHNYIGGLCLVFRLCVSDYHHYCYIDNGYQGENHFIPGVLHSVQPIACEKYPVYVLNRRNWCLLRTENFGPVVQCEIGALVVGGIVNENENTYFCKGQEKGHFELAGSTIVLLFEKGKIRLKPELMKKFSSSEELKVRQGEWIVGISNRG